jgi:hypothetical protein
MHMTALEIADAVWRAVNTHGHTGLELEFRLGHRLPGGTFTSNVGKDTFTKIVETLESSQAWDMVYDVDTIDMIHSAAKHVTTTAYKEGGAPAPAPPPRWMTKTKMATIDYETESALAARASVSIESFAPADPDPPPTTSRRIKSRRRFQWKCWAFDLTKVQSTLPGDLDNDDYSYEVEIELLDPGMLFERTMDSLAEWGMALVNDLLQMLK